MTIQPVLDQQNEGPGILGHEVFEDIRNQTVFQATVDKIVNFQFNQIVFDVLPHLQPFQHDQQLILAELRLLLPDPSQLNTLGTEEADVVDDDSNLLVVRLELHRRVPRRIRNHLRELGRRDFGRNVQILDRGGQSLGRQRRLNCEISKLVQFLNENIIEQGRDRFDDINEYLEPSPESNWRLGAAADHFRLTGRWRPG